MWFQGSNSYTNTEEELGQADKYLETCLRLSVSQHTFSIFYHSDGREQGFREENVGCVLKQFLCISAATGRFPN